MLYRFLKFFARLAIRIFCRRIFLSDASILKVKGPVLLASNHPNSFLDSIILDTLFEQPVWSLARGDVFKKPFHAKLLRALKILPVYRASEGVENLSDNYKTFADCIDLFHRKEIVTIFSEGRCINEWHLRPLKKGTARLAFRAWEERIPLTVIPVALNYSSFTRFGKNVWINFGSPITADQLDLDAPDGVRNLAFNALLQEQLQLGVWEIDASDKQKPQELLTVDYSTPVRVLLLIPACIGWIVHAPLYWPLKKYIWKRTHHNDHYDSAMTGALFVTYPFFLLLLTAIAWWITGSWFALSLLLLLPFCAWACVQLKPQLDRSNKLPE